MNKGCVSDFKRLFRDLKKATEFQKVSLEIVNFIVLSPRFPRTGNLKDNIQEYLLELEDKVILTSDRFYSTQSTNKTIFINSKKCIKSLQKCDIVKVANIRMKVLQVADLYVDCVVVFAGTFSSQSNVTFPSECDKFEISSEELEDIEFANDFSINIIVTPSPGCDGYLSSIKAQSIARTRRFFTKVCKVHLEEENQMKWILENYDGFFLDLESNEAGGRLISMSDVVRTFLDYCYHLKKPLILSGFKKKSLLHESFKHYFQCLPDKFLVQKEDSISIGKTALDNFLVESSSIIQNFAIDQLNSFKDNSLTKSDTFVIGIVSMVYTTCSDAIILYSYSGRMPVKISHFRPLCPIVTYIYCQEERKYVSMFYNIYTIPKEDSQKEYKDGNFPRNEQDDVCGLTPQKVDKALQFCLQRNFIEEGSGVILVFRSKIGHGFQNKFIHFKYKQKLLESEYNEILQ